MEKVLSSSEMKEGIVDPETCMIVPYSEFMKKCKIDIESGQRYLEVHPFGAIKDEVTGRKLTCAEAVRLGKVDLLPTLRLLQAQADSGGIVEGSVSQRLSLRAAVEQGLLDEEMAKLIATSQMRSGGIVDAGSGKRLTLKEAVEKELVSQKLAASLQEAQIGEDKYVSEVCQVDKPHLSQEKMEKISPKEEDVITSTSAKKSDGAEHKAGSEAVSYDVAGGAATATERSAVTPTEGKSKPQETSEDGVTLHPQEKVKVTPEYPLELGAASPPEETVVVRAVGKGMAKSSFQVGLASGKELRREDVDRGTEKVEGLEKEQLLLDMEMLHRAEDSEEKRRRRGFVSAEGVVGGEEGAVVASEQEERAGSLEGVTPAAPRTSVTVGQGEGEMGPTKSGEPPGTGIPVEPAGDKLAGKRTVKNIEGETPRLGAEGPVDQEQTSEKEVKPTQKRKSKKKKAKQTGVPGDSAQPEKPSVEKQSLPCPISKEIPGIKEEGDFVSGVPEPECETTAKITAGLTGDTAQHRGSSSHEEEKKTILEKDKEKLAGGQVSPVPPGQGEAQEVPKGGIRNGHDSSVAFSLEERMTQESTKVETTSDVPSAAPAAGELPHELIIREEPREVQESSAVLELGEETRETAETGTDQAPVPPKSQGETPQERTRQPGPGDRGLLLPVIVEGELLETSRESTRPAQELKEPLADTKSQLDATAFDIQFLISEHAQDLTPQQSRQLLRLLNELQKAFRDLSERVTARVEVLQVCLQQVEQTDQTLQEQQAARAQSLAELSHWLCQAEDTLAQQERAASAGDLSSLQQRQSDVKELQRNMHTRAASFASVLKSTEEFLEENKAKMEPGELAALQEKLQRAKEQYQSLQERTEVAQKELESAVSAAVQQETEKVTWKELQPLGSARGGQ
ncbi:microtubule-actin cross-linking factor 1 [Limosa lapponica baueri]|uniref:Microtubule-actin cross-linking factor 1 n=1 Tax=Limosa lapponica baueri TaxID=1758121 RepID=A0A2I0T4C2_LIMLA|nr:microtubule-actin cross-linking factor 1 [Limosa lapponica baueri]